MAGLRWKFTAVLETLSPLHLGDGGSNPDRIKNHRPGETPGRVATVFTDCDERAYLPGTSLKGWLRAFAERALEPGDCEKLFGTGDAAGRVWCFDARYASAPAEPNKLAEWHENRGTCVEWHVVVDRHTGTAAPGLLYCEEVAPKGTRFNLEFQFRRPSAMNDDEATRLASAFRALLGAFEGEGGGPLGIGGGTAHDQGRVRLSKIEVSVLTDAGVRRWLRTNGTNQPTYESSAKLPSYALRVEKTEAEYTLHLEFDGGFLVNDASRARTRDDRTATKQDCDDDEGNITAMRTNDCRPYLPPSSLHGALRHRAEKILSTMRKEAVPNPSGKPGTATGLASVDALSQAAEDPVALWFGAPGWRSLVRISYVSGTSKSGLVKQEMLAVDRFTGGGAERRKFNARYFWKPAIEMRLSIDQNRLEAALAHSSDNGKEAVLLLALTLRDLADGFVTIGAGKAKGFGTCLTRIEPAKALRLAQDMPPSVSSVFETGLRPRPVPAIAATATQPGGLRSADPAGDQAFYNPYHFAEAIPPRTESAPTLASLGQDEPLSHCRYHEGLMSGYIDCTITAETPIFVGGTQKQAIKSNTVVEHYERDGNVRIPATSIRGLVSTHHEALTSSSLRVLENSHYSVRDTMGAGALSALGMLVKRSVDGKRKWFMKPLALPTFHPQKKPLDPIWAQYFPTPILKQYVGGRDAIREPGFAAAHPNWTPAHRDPASSQIAGPLTWNADFTDVRPLTAVREKHGFRLAVLAGSGTPVPGIWRVLGCAEPRQIAQPKKHELFIPVTFSADFQVESNDGPEPSLIPVDDEVIDRFEGIARELTQDWRKADKSAVRPYEPEGTRSSRLPDGKPQRLQLKAGDVVYFGISKRPSVRVTEVSFSAIWRKYSGRSFEYFSRMSPHLLPMSPERRGQRNDDQVPITASEKLFGFVEMRPDADGGEEKAQNERPLATLASRVRFTDAEYNGNMGSDPRLDPVTLKILSSPKPPSPAMYFYKEGSDAFIAKTDLRPEPGRVPRGRKFYLHHAEALENPDAQTWKTADPGEHPDQKMRIRPVRRNAQFRFRMYFDNLSRIEMAELLLTLRPTADTRYKLGLGKPLGLGTIRLDPAGTLSALLPHVRYSEVGLSMDTVAHFAVLPVSDFRSALDVPEDYRRIHEMKYGRVFYPQTTRTGMRGATDDPESELYAWFVANDYGSGTPDNPPEHSAAKTALSVSDEPIQPLKVLPYTPPRGGSNR